MHQANQGFDASCLHSDINMDRSGLPPTTRMEQPYPWIFVQAHQHFPLTCSGSKHWRHARLLNPALPDAHQQQARTPAWSAAKRGPACKDSLRGPDHTRCARWVALALFPGSSRTNIVLNRRLQLPPRLAPTALANLRDDGGWPSTLLNVAQMAARAYLNTNCTLNTRSYAPPAHSRHKPALALEHGPTRACPAETARTEQATRDALTACCCLTSGSCIIP
eukprot:UN2689